MSCSTRSAFEPFWSRNAYVTGDYGGLGLGLPLVKRLVELNGGAIDVDSQIGEGTRVRLTLPTAVSDTSRPSKGGGLDVGGVRNVRFCAIARITIAISGG